EQAAGFAAATSALSAVDAIGQLSVEHVIQARQLLQNIPDELNKAARDSFSARALIYSLLISKSSDAVAQRQWKRLDDRADSSVVEHTKQLYSTVFKLERDLSLPLLELCIPTLKQLSAGESRKFQSILVDLIQADKTVDIFEWC